MSKQKILRTRTLLDVEEVGQSKQTLLRVDTKLDLTECLSPKKGDRKSTSPNTSPKKFISIAKSPVKIIRLLSPNSKAKILRQGTESDFLSSYIQPKQTVKRNLLMRKETVLEINESTLHSTEDKENSVLVGFIICISHDYPPILRKQLQLEIFFCLSICSAPQVKRRKQANKHRTP
jgi:hypothetical protein